MDNNLYKTPEKKVIIEKPKLSLLTRVDSFPKHEPLVLDTFQPNSIMQSEIDHMSGGFDKYVTNEVEQKKIEKLIKYRNPRVLRTYRLTENADDERQ